MVGNWQRVKKWEKWRIQHVKYKCPPRILKLSNVSKGIPVIDSSSVHKQKLLVKELSLWHKLKFSSYLILDLRFFKRTHSLKYIRYYQQDAKILNNSNLWRMFSSFYLLNFELVAKTLFTRRKNSVYERKELMKNNANPSLKYFLDKKVLKIVWFMKAEHNTVNERRAQCR